MPTDPINDIFFGDPCAIYPSYLAIPTSATNILSSSTSVPYLPVHSIPASASNPVDHSVVLMGQMSVLIE